MFEVSPDTFFFLCDRRVLLGRHQFSCFLFSVSEGLVLGEPVAFALSAPVPGLDTPPMTYPVYTLPSGLALLPGQSSFQTVMASAVSSRQEGLSSGVPRTLNVSREGPFDAYSSPMDTGDSPLVAMGLPGCPYQITSYTGLAVADTNPAYGMQLHHPRFLEFIGAPESAWLLYHSPMFWIRHLGEEDAINLQRDAGVMLSNLQVLGQFMTSLHRMSSEMLNLGMGRVVFPSEEVAALSTASRAAQYMAAMGLWHPQTDPGDPGPVPASSCNACMTCRYCFPEGPLPPGK